MELTHSTELRRPPPSRPSFVILSRRSDVDRKKVLAPELRHVKFKTLRFQSRRSQTQIGGSNCGVFENIGPCRSGLRARSAAHRHGSRSPALGETLFDDENGRAGKTDGIDGSENLVDEFEHNPLRGLVKHQLTPAVALQPAPQRPIGDSRISRAQLFDN